MKLNFVKLVITAGLSLGMLSFASIAEAALTVNSSSLSGQTDQQPQTQSKGARMNSSSLSGQADQQPQTQSKGRCHQGTSLTGQKTDKQASQ